MADGVGHIEIARAVLIAVRTEVYDLNSRMLDNPIMQIDLELAFAESGEAKRRLEILAANSDKSVRENVRWLTERCDANASN